MYLILDKIVCSNARMARHHENDLSMVNFFGNAGRYGLVEHVETVRTFSSSQLARTRLV